MPADDSRATPNAAGLCTMCEEAEATTTWGFPVCQPCADMLAMLDTDLKKMEAGDPALKIAGERIEQAFRSFLTCRCVWNGARCSHPATQEDGLCDWCGSRRPEQLADNPNTMTDPTTGEFLGLGGAGYDHIDPSVTPDACWMPNSGRTLLHA